jgi:hypothetical protein
MAVTEFFEGAIHALGIRTSEMPSYTVRREDGELEIRKYTSYIVAKMFMAGAFPQSAPAAFTHLLDYLSGNNSPGAGLPLPESAPRSGVHIPLTMPVLYWPGEGGWHAAVILPSKYTFSTAPKPLDAAIELERIPAQTMAALRYSGNADEAQIQQKFRELRGWVQSLGWRHISSPLAAQYDPPFTIPFLKRNEVLVRAEPLHS